MKKILSLALAALMLVSALPVAYAVTFNCPTHGDAVAADCGAGHIMCYECRYCSECNDVSDEGTSSTIPEVGKTTITLVGSQEASGSSYEVTVPASMAPGDSAEVTVTGNWASTETLKVTAPEKVTLYYGDQSMDVGITFTGISKAGSDTETVNASGTVTVADASALFGTWEGVLEYTVEMVEEEAAELITFTIDGTSYQAENGMTWGEWVAENNSVCYLHVSGTVYCQSNGRIVGYDDTAATADNIIEAKDYVTKIAFTN